MPSLSESHTPSLADMPPEAQQLVCKMMRDHYLTDWIDSPNDALKGKTPRQTAKQPRARKALKRLLKDLIYEADRGVMKDTFDFDELVCALDMQEEMARAT